MATSGKSTGIDSFSKKRKEKSVFKSLFARDSDSDSESEDSSAEEEEEEEKETLSPTDTHTDNNHNDDASPSVDDDITLYQSTVNGALCPLTVRIRERKVLGIAHQLWPAAGYLCDFLLSHPEHLLAPPSQHSIDSEGLTGVERKRLDVIELGAGLGLTSIYIGAFLASSALSRSLSTAATAANAAADSSAASCTSQSECVSCKQTLAVRIVCTDVEQAVGGIAENISLNAELLNAHAHQGREEGEGEGEEHTDKQRVEVFADELFWGRDDHVHRLMEKYFSLSPSLTHTQRDTDAGREREGPLVIAADVVYWESLFLPLVQTLVLLCRDYRCTVIVAHIKRWKKDSQFFALCKKHHLTVVVLEEKVLRERDVHHNNPDNEEFKKTVQRIYKITAAR